MATWCTPGNINGAFALKTHARVDYTYMTHLLQDWTTGYVDGILPHTTTSAYAVKKTFAPDQPPWHTAINGPQAEQWLEAAQNEISELDEKRTWTEMHKQDLPPNANVLPGTWVLKVKRYPDGQFRKFKARYCVRGDKQLEGVDYFQTYAPVVS